MLVPSLFLKIVARSILNVMPRSVNFEKKTCIKVISAVCASVHASTSLVNV